MKRASAILQAVAGLLEQAEVLDTDATVRGEVDGQPVSFALKLKTMNSISNIWSEVSAPAPDAMILRIRPTTPRDELEIEKGLTRAHRVGDPRFDDTLVVEGAPEHWARAMLDDEALRKGLLALDAAVRRIDGTINYVDKEPYAALPQEQLVTTTEGRFVVHSPGWNEDVDRTLLLLRLAARLAHRSAEVARSQAHAAPHGTTDYRGQGASAARLRDEQEVRALELQMAKREQWRKRREVLRWVLFGVLVALGCLAYELLRAR